jgi:uncharacterized Fe-S cluster protein YjdI
MADAVKRDYATEAIVVHWDSVKCMHSTNCINALPAVFDTSRRPWVDVRATGIDADAIAAAVDTCPSGALTYTRLDGVAPGRAGQLPPTADDVVAVVTVRRAGPLVIDGPVRVETSDGEVLGIERRVFLCRCGHSTTKPFCDGSHKAHAGFDDPLAT